MSEELKPCPFCGGQAEFNDTSSTWVRCESCGAAIECQVEKKDAAQLWNSRSDATLEKLREALEKIIAADDTGPTVYELRENGPSQAIGGSEGRFAAIARAALKGDAPNAEAAKAAAQGDYEKRILSTLEDLS